MVESIDKEEERALVGACGERALWGALAARTPGGALAVRTPGGALVEWTQVTHETKEG